MSTTAQKTQSAIAADFGVSIRTVKRWKAEGLPLDEPMQLLRSLGQRKRVPVGLRRVLGRLVHVSIRPELPSAVISISSPHKPNGPTTRLEQE